MASVPELLYTKAGVDAAIALALSGLGPGQSLNLIDNGDGTGSFASAPTSTAPAATVVDNGDGTFTITTSGPSTTTLTDHLDGTFDVFDTASMVDNGDATFNITG